MGSGLTFALGNVVFGINCSQKGVYGGGFPGPASLLLVGLYKFYEQIQVRRKTGHWIDKANSNYWKRADKERESAVNSHDEYTAANEVSENESHYTFNWVNLVMVFFAQAMTSLAGLILVSYCFKFAKMAGIN